MQYSKDGLLVDWLTIRYPLSKLNPAIEKRFRSFLGFIECYDSLGKLKWRKHSVDVDRLRSDSKGIFWQVTADADANYYLTIGGSPAGLRSKDESNIFGDLSLECNANALLLAAQRALDSFLPHYSNWQVRRIDITANYKMSDHDEVNQLLKQLLITDGARRKASSSRVGNTVMWSATSDLSRGKAYEKGSQLEYLRKKGQCNLSNEQIDSLKSVIRFEHTRGSRFFRRLEKNNIDFWKYTEDDLFKLYLDFFERLFINKDIVKMKRETTVYELMQKNDISEGMALAAFTTLRNIKIDGIDNVKLYMAKTTFYRHLKYIRNIGFTDADLYTANIINFERVKVVFAKPVQNWQDLGIAA